MEVRRRAVSRDRQRLLRGQLQRFVAPDRHGRRADPAGHGLSADDVPVNRIDSPVGVRSGRHRLHRA